MAKRFALYLSFVFPILRHGSFIVIIFQTDVDGVNDFNQPIYRIRIIYCVWNKNNFKAVS